MSPFLFAAESPARQFANFEVPGWVWAAFVAVVVALLLVDCCSSRTPHVISFREAGMESAVWVALRFGFVLVMLVWQEAVPAGEYEDRSPLRDGGPPEHNRVLRSVRRVVPTTNRYDGQKLFSREGALTVATPLFTVRVLVEATDVVFAVDSVPAILASAVSRSSCSLPTRSPSWGCARCTSCSQEWPAAVAT